MPITLLPLLAKALLLAQFMGLPGFAPAAEEQSASARAPTTTVSTTQPATQPAQVEITVKTQDGSSDLIEEFSRTRLGQLADGKMKLSLDQVLEPTFWFETVRDMVYFVLGFIPRLIIAFLFLVFFWAVYRTVRKLVVGSLTAGKIDESIRDMLGHLIKWAIMGFGIVIACSQIGINIAGMLAGVSIIGLAIGFAAQESLANFIAGIVIFWDKPFKIGDWIEIDGELAQVNRVTFRSTRLSNLDNDVIVMPNTTMLNTKLINKSTNLITRASVPIGIAYKESIDKAREVLLAIVRDDPRIMKEPEPIVEVRACAASSVDLMLHFWIRDERYEDAMNWEFLEKAKKALDAAGIEIPFPHMQVLLEKTPAIDQLAPKPRNVAA